MITEHNAQIAIANYFEYKRNTIITSFYFHDYECDVLVLSKSGYITEIEIKLNMADLKKDKNKSKWECPSRSYIKKFFYAVPFSLVEKAKNIIDDRYGILSLRYDETKKRCYAFLHREAKVINKIRPGISDTMKLKMLTSSYYRFWDLNIRNATNVNRY